MSIEEMKALQTKIEEAVKIAHQKMLEEKRLKNQPIVIVKDGKIQYVKP
jgi:hypothetical protein